MPPQDLKDIGGLVPLDLYERLRAYAFDRHLSQAEIIRRALDDYLPKTKTKKKPGN